MTLSGKDITFRPHRLGFFAVLAILLGAGIASIQFGRTLHPFLYAGAVLAITFAVALVSRYTAGSVALRGYDLVLFQGTFVSREEAFPLWMVRIEIRQTLIGRMLDTGTLLVQVGRKQTRCRVAQLQALRRLVAERKLQFLMLMERHKGELDDQPGFRRHGRG